MVTAARIGWIVGALLVASAYLTTRAAEPAPARVEGETWEQTTQMTAMGMNMPERKLKFCRAKNADPSEPPMPDDSSCTMTDLQTAGSRVSWKISCKAPQAMSGTGEITYNGRDAYTGTMNMSAPQGEMTMRLAGRRIGEACDPGEAKRNMERKVVAMQKQSDDAQRQMADAMRANCMAQAEGFNIPALTGAESQCKDPAYKEAMCRKFRTEEGFSSLREPQLQQVAAFCGANADAVRADLCAMALQRESLDFLGQNCPEQAKPIAQRECAGRKYTSMAAGKYGSFCAKYAASMMAEGDAAAGAEGGAQPAEPAADSKEGAVKKAKKKLSGLFGR